MSAELGEEDLSTDRRFRGEKGFPDLSLSAWQDADRLNQIRGYGGN